MDLNTRAGRAIREARQAAGLSRERLLTRAGHPVTLRWLVALEQGRATWRLDVFETLAKALDREPAALLVTERAA